MSVNPDSVIVTTGSSGGFLLSFLAVFEPGDTVALARPGYPAYRNMLRALGCRVLEIETQDRFALQLADLQGLVEAPAGLIIASPANPTGTMIAPGKFAAIVRWCEANGVRLISDEIYHGITYGQRAASAWESGREAIVVNSFSKYFSMTGWRLGWLLVPDALVEPIDRLAGNFALCPPTLSQVAAIHAFDDYAELDANVVQYQSNRDLMLHTLPAMGMGTIAPADGAFYVYADISRWSVDSLTWCDELLAATGVAIAPGIDFDQEQGGRFVRMCFAGEEQTVSGALAALSEWLAV
jgi:aspartate/methionine/tyrosine aminotransferase